MLVGHSCIEPLGGAVIAHRFIFGSRDDAADERLELLNDREGV